MAKGNRFGAACGLGSAALILACLPGCYFHYDGSVARLTQPPVLPSGDAWPVTDQRALDEVVFASEDAPVIAAEDRDLYKAIFGQFPSPQTMGDGTIRGRVIRTANAVVRVRLGKDGLPTGHGVGFEGLFSAVKPNAFVLTSVEFGCGLEEFHARRDRGEGTRGGCLPEVLAARAEFTSGVPVRLPAAMPEHPRGVLVHLAALMGNPYETEVMAELSRRGWVVVDIDTETSVVSDMPLADVDRALAMQEASEELGKHTPMFSQYKSYELWKKAYEADPAAKAKREIDDTLAQLVRPVARLCCEADVEPVAESLATRIDATAGTNAFATEAALDVLGQLFPQTRSMPLAVVGFSAGALSTPTIAARIRERVNAAVIIGGAANIAVTAIQSTLTSGGIRVACDGKKVDDDLVEKLGAAYLRHSKLDPYHTAAALRGVPVLQIHATWDRWVPADGGRLLTARLGEPELLEMPGGHGMLFYFLPWKKEWIADWLDRAVPEASSRTLKDGTVVGAGRMGL